MINELRTKLFASNRKPLRLEQLYLVTWYDEESGRWWVQEAGKEAECMDRYMARRLDGQQAVALKREVVGE